MRVLSDLLNILNILGFASYIFISDKTLLLMFYK
jgi:hypothetical protein